MTLATEHPSDEALAAWAEGGASPEQVKALTGHVARCVGCRRVLSELIRASGAPPRETIARYVLTERVGVGGMGTVWSAWDPQLARRVAIKISHERRAGDAERFMHERQVLAGLEHPNIARLLDAGETADARPWFAMDFVDGEPIDRYCERNRLLLRQRVELFLPVLAAVEHAHRHLVVHRDLKPSNVLVDRAGQPRLVDFGIARMLEREMRLTETGHVPMTPAFASPEQVRGEPVTTSSDVYSLGVTRRCPFGSAGTAIGPAFVISGSLFPGRLPSVRRERSELDAWLPSPGFLAVIPGARGAGEGGGLSSTLPRSTTRGYAPGSWHSPSLSARTTPASRSRPSWSPS